MIKIAYYTSEFIFLVGSFCGLTLNSYELNNVSNLNFKAVVELHLAAIRVGLLMGIVMMSTII